MLEHLSCCTLCPHECRVNRLDRKTGQCGATGRIKLALASLHQWEEPCISGTNGSGTVFFSGCNLHCAYCQNYDISQNLQGKEISVERLANIFLEQEDRCAHNINLVSPTPYIPLIKEALISAKSKGLTIPVVYNSNAYENVHALRMLEGLIDVYLPDLKYAYNPLAVRYSAAPEYFFHATQAILEMYRQVGIPQFNAAGLIQKGIIIRHLVLPGQLDNTRSILEWIRNHLPLDVFVSLMGQYVPVFHAVFFPEINRKLWPEEYDKAVDYFFAIGLQNGYAQELESACEDYIPDFNLRGV